MTNPMFNPQPNYSGVTIQISNPAVNVGGGGNTGYRQDACAQYCTNPQYYSGIIPQTNASQAIGYAYPQSAEVNQGYIQGNQPAQAIPGQAYPAQYYLNNYNYQNNGLQGKAPQGVNEGAGVGVNDGTNGVTNNGINTPSQNNQGIEENAPNAQAQNEVPENEYLSEYKQNEKEEVQDFTKSNNIIDDLNARQAELKEKQKNTKEKRVVALTDEYIMSLENYLNNQNSEIRLMASKEILKRLDEDKSRFDDAALNALLNKMLQDPSKLIRVAAMSAFASRLACGNDYTVQLLKNMQANPSADKEDVLQAADILLKMSSSTEIKQVPVPEAKKGKNIEPEAEPEPNIKPIDRPKEA